MELLTNFPRRRSLFSQLKRDLSEDRQLSHVDIICSYIKQSGVNQLRGIFQRLAQEGVKVRVITTTLMDISEPAAIKDLASVIGEDNLKVTTHSVNDVTFHAKGWRFHESQPSVPPDGEPGYSHAIIGSSNMSYPALNVGVEWNVLILDVNLGGDVLATFDDTFEKYWKDDHPDLMVEDFKNVHFDLLEAMSKEEAQFKCKCDHCKQIKGNATAVMEKIQKEKFQMRQQNKEKWKTRKANVTQAGANQGLMITPTPEVDMKDAPSAYSNTPLVDQQHNLYISGPSSPSSTSVKRPQEDDHESASQPAKRRSLVFSQATRVSGPPPFDADQSIVSEVEQFVESTYEQFSNQFNGLRDELTNFANQSILTAGDTIKTSARIAIGTDLLQKIPLRQTGAVEIARIAKLSRFVSGQVWRAMSLRQDPSLRQSLTATFVTQTMREAARALRDRVSRFTNVYQEAEIVVSKAAFWTVAAVSGLTDTYETTASALDTFFRGAQGRWEDEEVVIAVEMAMKNQSSELEDLAMLVILAAQSNGDFGEKFKDAGGQRWKEWLREKKEDPNVGHFLREAYPQDE